MGIFNKKNNSTTDEPVQNDNKLEEQTVEIPTVKVDLKNSDEVNKRLTEIYNMESLYIILSNTAADLERGLSVPIVLAPNEKDKVIVAFTDYAKAKRYALDKCHMEIDGVLTIGEAKKSDKINNIDVICANALAMGVTAIDFDIDDENGFGCKLPYFMQINKMSGKGQVAFTKAEIEKIKADGGKFKPRFNAMHIVDFKNPYLLKRDRADEVKAALIGEDGIEWAKENCAVHELCWGANSILHDAVDCEKAGDMDACEKNKVLVNDINELIFDKLAKLDKWYTLVDKESGDIYTQKGAVYIVYTPRYANRMPKGTKLVSLPPSVAELVYLIGNKEVNIVAVTDGPNIIHIIDRNVFGF